MNVYLGSRTILDYVPIYSDTHMYPATHTHTYTHIHTHTYTWLYDSMFAIETRRLLEYCSNLANLSIASLSLSNMVVGQTLSSRVSTRRLQVLVMLRLLWTSIW